MSCQKIKELCYSCKMDICVLKCIHCKYNCSQPCSTLLTNYTLLTCDNYITTKIHM
jgi:hypothetical protein